MMYFLDGPELLFALTAQGCNGRRYAVLYTPSLCPSDHTMMAAACEAFV